MLDVRCLFVSFLIGQADPMSPIALNPEPLNLEPFNP
jgi:hypothetical protein